MGTHLIPREVSGEGRILYVFTPKGFLYALIGLGVGTVVKSLLSVTGADIVGWAVLVILTLIGWAIGQGKIPDSNANAFFRKVGGVPIDTVIKRFLKFNKNKKLYVSKVTNEKEENTEDKIVGLDPKEQSIVLVTDKVEKVIDLSLYKILELYIDYNIVVYSLSDNEYMALKEDLNEDLSLKEYNNKCLMQYIPNIKLFKLNNYDDKENPSSFILDENLRPKREISDEMIQEYFNNKPDAIIYTTETYEDVISSYITEKHNFYDNDNEKTSINKKVLFKFKK